MKKKPFVLCLLALGLASPATMAQRDRDSQRGSSDGGSRSSRGGFPGMERGSGGAPGSGGFPGFGGSQGGGSGFPSFGSQGRGGFPGSGGAPGSGGFPGSSGGMPGAGSGFPGASSSGFGGRGGSSMFGGDPNEMFNRMSNGKDSVTRAEVQASNPIMAMMFDRMAERMGVTNGVMTRQQFTTYMQERMSGRGGPGGSSSGGPGGSGGTDGLSEMLFRRADANGDGLLNYDEMSESLRTEREKFDANRDGFVDLNEFKSYMQARAQSMTQSSDGRGGSGPGMQGYVPPPEEDEPKPVVYRAGKLPKDMPPWFKQLDTDEDGQIGLYEWRNSGRALEEFNRFDRNGDGFLVVEEVMRVVVQQKEQGNGDGARDGSFAGLGGMDPSAMRGSGGFSGGGFGGGGFAPPGGGGSFGMGGRGAWPGMGGAGMMAPGGSFGGKPSRDSGGKDSKSDKMSFGKDRSSRSGGESPYGFGSSSYGKDRSSKNGDNGYSSGQSGKDFRRMRPGG